MPQLFAPTSATTTTTTTYSNYHVNWIDPNNNIINNSYYIMTPNTISRGSNDFTYEEWQRAYRSLSQWADADNRRREEAVRQREEVIRRITADVYFPEQRTDAPGFGGVTVEERGGSFRGRRAAMDRAEETLLGLLGAENQELWKANRRVEVIGSRGTRYRIDSSQGYTGNITRLSDGQRFCAHPPMNRGDEALPLPDAIIAQMLAITDNEDEFLRVANRW